MPGRGRTLTTMACSGQAVAAVARPVDRVVRPHRASGREVSYSGEMRLTGSGSERVLLGRVHDSPSVAVDELATFDVPERTRARDQLPGFH